MPSTNLNPNKKGKQKYINYLEVFTIPEIWWQVYPVYHVSARGNMFSIKGILYPDTRSVKKYTRKNQLIYRSLQAKIFDSLLNIGYFDPLPVVREFPIIIQNRSRQPGQRGSYYLADYFFPTALGGRGLAVELDSDYHSEDSDSIRDKYLMDELGLQTFRIKNFDKPQVQKDRFKELCALLRSEPPSSTPRTFDFMTTIREFVNMKLTTLPPGSIIPLINDDEEIF